MSEKTNINRIYETPGDSTALPVVAGTEIFQGELIGRTPDGHCRPIEPGDHPAGFAKEYVDNTKGTHGDKVCEIKATGLAVLFIEGLRQDAIGRKIYASDSLTFTQSENGGTHIGKVVRIDKDDHGIVAFDFLYQETTAVTVTEPTPEP